MIRRLSFLLILLAIAGCASPVADLAKITPPKDPWFEEQVTAQPGVVIVDFSATWCGPCKMLKPFLEQLEREHGSKVKVVMIDYDARPDLVKHYSVESVPTLLMMKGGSVIDVCRGAPPTYDEVLAWASPHFQ